LEKDLTRKEVEYIDERISNLHHKALDLLEMREDTLKELP
jgi:hypothetical protein